jgi:hypothetical protein
MPGKKTHEQQIRTFERKPDVPPDGRQMTAELAKEVRERDRVSRPRGDARQSEFPVSSGGMNQESRDHNKHNHQTQHGHKPQSHTRAEEKH